MNLRTFVLGFHKRSNVIRRPELKRIASVNNCRTSSIFNVNHERNNFKHSSRLFCSSVTQPIVTVTERTVNYFEVDTSDKIDFGDYQTIASNKETTDKKYSDVKLIGTDKGPSIGDKVWIRGRVSSVRAKGNACFMVIRSDAFYTIQGLHFKDKTNPDISKSMIKYVGSIPVESIVDIVGKVVTADVKSCSQNNVEIQIEKVFVVSRTSEEIITASQDSERPFPRVTQETRLDNRWLDLRVPSNNAIMRIKSGVSQLFREALYARDFLEIQSPKLIAGESEGGSDVFRTDYFGQ
eukprot:gene9104-18867_t